MKKVLQGSECGFGKTRVDVLSLLFLISNNLLYFITLVCSSDLGRLEKRFDICSKAVELSHPLCFHDGGKLKAENSKQKIMERGVIFSSFESAKKLKPVVQILKDREELSYKHCLLLVDESHNIKTWEGKSLMAKSLFEIVSCFNFTIFNSGSFIMKHLRICQRKCGFSQGLGDLCVNTVDDFKSKFGCWGVFAKGKNTQELLSDFKSFSFGWNIAT